MTDISKIRVWEEFYRSSDVVAQYARQTQLQVPERAIFDRLAGQLAEGSLLDLGVGAGRTTHELAPRCRHYVGADYAEPMVQACRTRFGELIQRRGARFEVADARALPFEDADFDVVFFSYNGIDLVGAHDRATVLAQCRRVLRPGGWLVYSSHNLNWFDDRRGIRWQGVRHYLQTLAFRRRMRRLNQAHWPIAGKPEIDLVDPFGGGLTCYIRPAEMLRQTRAAGFGEIRVFDLLGQEVPEGPVRDAMPDPWVYLMARQGVGA